MDISQFTWRKLELRKNRVKLADVIQIALEASRALIEEASHQFQVSVIDPRIRLFTDPNRLVD